MSSRLVYPVVCRYPSKPRWNVSPASIDWKPAENANDYFRNCQEGLETFSERKFAKLAGMSRIELWRAKMMAEIPELLFESEYRCFDPVSFVAGIAGDLQIADGQGRGIARRPHRSGCQSEP